MLNKFFRLQTTSRLRVLTILQPCQKGSAPQHCFKRQHLKVIWHRFEQIVDGTTVSILVASIRICKKTTFLYYGSLFPGVQCAADRLLHLRGLHGHRRHRRQGIFLIFALIQFFVISVEDHFAIEFESGSLILARFGSKSRIML